MIYANVSKRNYKHKKYGKDVNNKLLYKNIQPAGLVLKPTTTNVSEKRIYGDNLLKHMSTLENQIDELYKSKYPSDVRNYYVSSLMRKLENLHNFYKRKQGGLYRISKPPSGLQTTPNRKIVLPEGKKQKIKRELLTDSDGYESDVFIEPVVDIKIPQKSLKKNKKQQNIKERKHKYTLRTQPKKTVQFGDGYLKKNRRQIKLIRWE